MALLAAYAVASVCAAASVLWIPTGTFGLATDYDAVVRTVLPDGPAARSGIRTGDRIRLASVRFADRHYVAGVDAPIPPGAIVEIGVERERDSSREVRLRAVVERYGIAERATLLLQCVAALVFIAVGVALVLKRPTPATWGFGLYCLLVLPTANYPFRLPNAQTALAEILTYDVVQNLGIVGIVFFALEFPQRFLIPWRKRAVRWLPFLFVVLAGMTVYPDYANLVLGRGANLENNALQLVFGATLAFAYFVLLDTYRRVDVGDRERLRWILVGFGVGLTANYVGNTLAFGSILPFTTPDWILNLLVSLNILLPLAVAHAVIRHRVLDIKFIVSRALVYATMTTILAALFALLDWFFGGVLEEFRLARFVEAALSVGVAFAFDQTQKRIERTIESVFFRKRHASEGRLTRLAHDLPQALSIGAIENAATLEVADILSLRSAALFRTKGTTFERVASFGWKEGDCSLLDDSDPMVLTIRSEKRCTALAELPLRHARFPIGERAPTVAVPMHARADVAGILFYGPHVGGNDIDPTELALLERVAHAACVGLDEIEMERLRDENARQLATIIRLSNRSSSIDGSL